MNQAAASKKTARGIAWLIAIAESAGIDAAVIATMRRVRGNTQSHQANQIALLAESFGLLHGVPDPFAAPVPAPEPVPEPKPAKPRRQQMPGVAAPDDF